MSRGDFSFMRPVRVRSRAVLGRYFFRSDHSTRLVVKEEVLVPGLCGTLVKPMTSLLGVWVVVGIGATNSAGNSTGRRFSTARKPCNSNAVTSWFERVARELHAKLVVDPAMRGPGPAGWWLCLAAVPVGGGGAWPGFETTRRTKHQRPGTTGVEGAGGTGGHGRASRRGAERSEALASRAAGASGARNTRGATSSPAR